MLSEVAITSIRAKLIMSSMYIYMSDEWTRQFIGAAALLKKLTLLMLSEMVAITSIRVKLTITRSYKMKQNIFFEKNDNTILKHYLYVQ